MTVTREVNVELGWKLQSEEISEQDPPCDVDAAMERAGGAGRFQMRYLAALGATWILWAMITFEVVFVGHKAKWHLTHSSTVEGTVDEASKCKLQREAWAWASPSATIVAEFDLSCEHAARLPLLTTIFFFGFMVGLPLGGVWSDTRGRKEATIGGLLMSQVPAVISFLATSYATYAVARFLFGFSCAIFGMTAFVWISEMLGSKIRSVPAWWMNCNFAVGQMLMSPLAYLLPEWRHLLVAMFLVGLGLLSYMWCLEESPRWLATQGRLEEAHAVVARIAAANGRSPPPALGGPAADAGSDGEGGSGAEEGVPAKAAAGPSFGQLLDARLRCRVLIGCVTWFTVAAAFWGLSLNSGNLPLSMYVSNLIGGAVQIPAYLLSGFLIEAPWCGRRYAVAGGFFLGGACLLASAFTESNGMLLALYYAGSCGVSISFGVAFLYTSELFPSNIRSLGLSVTAVFSRVGAMVSPFVPAAAAVSPALPMILFGAPCLLAGALQLLLQETRGTTLPDTIEDIGAAGEESEDGTSSNADLEGSQTE